MLTCQFDKFSLPADQHYLNCAYQSPLMRSIELAGIEALRLKRDPSQVTPSMFFDGVNQIRSLFAKLIHGKADRVCMIPSTSYGIATIAQNLSLGSGDNIILIEGQFPSNVYAWRRLSKKTGATIHTVTGDSTTWTQKVLETINYRTAVVAMETVHWANGYSFDLLEISQRARTVGAQLILDGTQSIGALPFDVQKIKPDALICAGYKWLFGPYGTAIMHVGERFIDGIPLEESWIARDGSENFGNLVNYKDQYRSGAVRFDRGQANVFSHSAMLIESLKQLLDWQPQRIQSYCSELIQDFLPAIQSNGYKVSESNLSHIFAIGLPEHINLYNLNDELMRQKISVSVRGNAIRISPNVYNNSANINALQDVLLSVVK